MVAAYSICLTLLSMDTGGSFTEIIVNPVVHPLKSCLFTKLLPRLIIFASAPQSGRISCSRAWTTQLEMASLLDLSSTSYFAGPNLVSTSLIVSGSTGFHSSQDSQNNSIASLMPRLGWPIHRPPPPSNLDIAWWT